MGAQKKCIVKWASNPPPKNNEQDGAKNEMVRMYVCVCLCVYGRVVCVNECVIVYITSSSSSFSTPVSICGTARCTLEASVMSGSWDSL